MPEQGMVSLKNLRGRKDDEDQAAREMKESTISGDLEESRKGGIRKIKKEIESDQHFELKEKQSFFSAICGCGKQNITTGDKKHKKEPRKLVTSKQKLKRRDSC
jgi:hypothetical protein